MKFKRYSLVAIFLILSTHIFCQRHCVDTVINSKSLTCSKFRGDPTGAKFAAYIERKVLYPKIERNQVLTGSVFIRFIVDVDGDIKNLEIVKGLRSDYDKAVLEVINSSPKWKPAMFDEKPIQQLRTMQINFLRRN